jgi:Domain of unknown function (DUF1990)
MAVELPRRAAEMVTWPAGVALTSWTYIWRTTPIHRREVEGSPAEDLPPELPDWVSEHDVQRPVDGSGPLFHRLYTGRIRDASWSAEELMERLRADPNLVAPLTLARFRKTVGPPWRMELGDEFVVRMPGPWDGPIRVIEITPRSFRFATLDGHLEAGQIEWRARDESGRLVFQIESWARAGDRLSALMHDRLRMAKEVQLHMWTSVVEKVRKRTGGRLEHGISIETRRVPPDAFEDGAGARL